MKATTRGAHSLNVGGTHVKMLREQYLCPHFHILVMGRANAGKTTILEKVCGVAKGTKPIIYGKDGKKLAMSATHLMASIERGLHDINHQITYPGSNFIFHDSQGFESGSTDELKAVWKFIRTRSAETELKNQLHVIWYCIPMDSPRPILPAELEFFNKGTGRVPLVVIFTKFDGQIASEFVNLTDARDEDKWDRAREIAKITFQKVYLPKVMDTKYPPKTYVQLEDMDLPEKNCAELTQQTADAIDDDGINQLFVSTQMNNLDLCVKSALQHVLKHKDWTWEDVIVIVFGKFPHLWVDRAVTNEQLSETKWFEKGKKESDREIEYDGGPPQRGQGGHVARLQPGHIRNGLNPLLRLGGGLHGGLLFRIVRFHFRGSPNPTSCTSLP